MSVVYPRVGGVAGSPNYIGSTTLANRPAASAALAGCMVLLTDVGATGGTYYVCDGTYWKPISRQRLYAMHSQQTITAGNTSTIVGGNVVVPAGAMGLNGGICVTVDLSAGSSSSHVLVAALAGTTFYTATMSATTSTRLVFSLNNRNSAAAQRPVANASTNVASLAVTNLTKDTTSNQNLTITLQAVTNNALCESVLVEIY